MTVFALFTSVASCGLQRKLHKPPSLGARGMSARSSHLSSRYCELKSGARITFRQNNVAVIRGLVSHRDERVLTVLKAENHPGIEQSPHPSDSINFRQSALG